MKVFIGLFVFAAFFGAASAIVYSVLSHEPAGATLLGFVAAAMALSAGYAIAAERDANVEGDEQASDGSAAGDDLGIFTTSSAWPIAVAFCAATGLVASIYSPLLCILASIALILCTWRMGAESART